MRYRPILRNRRRGHGATAALNRLLPLTGGRCLYCDVHIAGGDGTVDHFIPLSHGGTYGKLNLVPACRICNEAKGDREPWGWIDEHCDADTRDRVRRYQRRVARL